MKQANLFLNGTLADYGSLIQRDLYTIAADGGVVNALRNSCTVAAIIGDGDSYPQDKQDIPFIHTPDQNATDFEKALSYLQAHHYTHISVYCFQGDRIDHMLAGLSSCLQFPDLDIELYTAEQRLRRLSEESVIHTIPNETISLIPFPETHGVTTNGLAWELNKSTLKLGSLVSISNRALHTQVKIQYTKGVLYLIRPIR